MVWGKKKKKDKKVKINVVSRPKPAKVVAKPVLAPAPKPVPVPKPAVKVPAKVVDIVKIHMLGNAAVEGKQYLSNTEHVVSMKIYNAIGTSCVSMAKWKSMQPKGGLTSLHK